MIKMTPFKELVSYEEALKRTCSSIEPINRKEYAPVEEASNRVLAEDLVASISVPPFDRAAMDGYAVRAEETFGASSYEPKTLKLTETLHAGATLSRMLIKGECVQVATGSPIPKGADAVVMVEFTERDNDNINISKPVYPGSNISYKGEDIEEGKAVLKAGEHLSPARIGMLAALGRKEVKIYEKPRVAIVPTGTEIQEAGSPLEEGHIYDVNSYTLSGVIDENGAATTRYEAVPDEADEIKKAVKKLLEYDMIVFSGGSSVGERDLLINVLQDLGTIIFHGIQIKPGKPTLFSMIAEKPVFGMPGYPTSCLLNAYLLIVPAVRKMARLPPKMQRTVKVRLAQRVASSTGRKQFLTVRLKDNQAYPVFKQSGAITSMAQADGYIILPINVDVVEKNQEVKVFLFN